MIIGLTVKNKLGFIDGSVARPTATSHQSWIVCMTLLVHIMQN